MRRRFQANHRAIIWLVLILLAIPVCGLADELRVGAYRDFSFPGDKTRHWAVQLNFNHPVFPSNLESALTVTRDGVPEPVDVEKPRQKTKATEAARAFRLMSKDQSSAGGTIKIVIDQGLGDASGRLLLGKPFTYEFLAVETVSVSGWSTYYTSKQDKGLEVSLSSYIPEADFRSALTVTPSVPDLKVSRGTGSSFRISGDFALKKEYEVRIAAKKVDDGRFLLKAKEFRFKGPGLKPDIAARTDRSVIELRGRQLYPLTLAAVDKVRCKLTRIPPYLLADLAPSQKEAHKPLPQRRARRGAADDTADSSAPAIVLSEDQIGAVKALAKAPGAVPAFLGDFTEDSEVFFASAAEGRSFGYSLPLAFRRNPDRGGCWLAALSDPDGNFAGTTAKLVQVTDLSISYKISTKGLLIWVTSLHTGQPVAAADLLLCDKNGNRYFAGKADQNGVLQVKQGQKFPATARGKEAQGLSQQAVDLAALTWAVAATGADACGVELTELRFKPFAVTQVKELKEKPEPRTGYLFTERGVYRPGESVHFKFYARAYQDHQIVAASGEKAKIEIVGPKDDVVYSKELTLGEFGTCYDTFATETFFPTGTYTIRATLTKPDNSTEQFSTTFQVQEYKRPRHLVKLSFTQGRRPAKDYVGVKREESFLTANIAADYYTGGPVKHARVRWKATLVPVTNTAKGLDAYFFGNRDDKTQFLESGEALLDDTGKLALTIPLDARLLTGIYGVQVSATVLDIDGEPATDVDTFNPRPDFLVGISDHPQQVQNGYATPLKIVVVDQDGKSVQRGKIEARIMKKDYFYTQKRDEAGNVNYRWEQGWIKALTSTVEIAKGEAQFNLELNDYGDYLISFTYQEKAGQYSSQTLFKVGWQQYDDWMRERTEKEVPTSNEVMVSMTKKEYRVGEPIRMGFHTSRPVKNCLVAVEKDEILEYRVIQVNGTDGSAQFTATEGFRPNVYVSFIAAAGREDYPVYPSQVDTDIPTVYHGYANVSIRSDTKKFKVEIAPDVAELKGRPGEKKSLTFRVSDEGKQGAMAELAVCVVDEAVLALTRYKTPELSSLNNFNLPLAVFSGDLRLALVSQDLFRMFTTRPLTGGGMGLGLMAASLKFRKDFRPVAYFNPALLTDKSGRATVEFDLPDSTTTYRIYAVACDRDAGFASADRKMVVTKEFFVDPSPPRFMVPGDKLTFPVTLQNKTKEKGKASLAADASKDLKIDLSRSSEELAPYGSSTLPATVQAVGGADQALIRFVGKLATASATYDDAIQQEFPIHSRYMPVHRAILGSFSKRGEVAFKLPDILKTLKPDDISPQDLQAHLSLSLTNWSKIAPGLKYLLHYPYGCVEQTSSGIIPLAGIRGLCEAGAFPGISVKDVDRFMEGGVDRLLSMQLADGGFSYWPGSLETSWWGTMYATFALTAASQAGYKVPTKRMEMALKFLRQGLFDGESEDRYHGSQWVREYVLLDLANGGVLDRAEFERFFHMYDSLGDQGKALLLLVAKKIGYLPPEKLRPMLTKLKPGIDPKKYDYYNSSVRKMAVCLMAATEIGGLKSQADSWAGLLMNSLKSDGKWNSTADTGWALLALSKYYEGKAAGQIGKVLVSVDLGGDKPVQVEVSQATANVAVPIDRLLEDGKIGLKADKDTLVNYTLSITYPDMATDPSQLEKGFSLTKKTENLNGKDEIRVGDVVRVTLEIGIPRPGETGFGERLEYLVLEDPVPAGLVPVNPDLKTEGAQEEPKSKSDFEGWSEGSYLLKPSHSEFRDDGVRIFKDHSWYANYRYSYLARATSEGDYWMRGSRVSLMYDPDRFGKTLGRRIKVLPAAK
ncbi:MAG: hypothetical protein HY914_07550 [Desulfomonile tiedjei]|nr:hypothetical protein [Desulfomonile tiedjei]